MFFCIAKAKNKPAVLFIKAKLQAVLLICFQLFNFKCLLKFRSLIIFFGKKLHSDFAAKKSLELLCSDCANYFLPFDQNLKSF